MRVFWDFMTALGFLAVCFAFVYVPIQINMALFAWLGTEHLGWVFLFEIMICFAAAYAYGQRVLRQRPKNKDPR